MNTIRRAIPNLFTSANLLCGMLAIIASFKGEILTAIELIILSLVFDFMDGLVARVLRAPSEFGKQLDSLADVISFGAAPACIIYNFIGLQIEPTTIDFYSFENFSRYIPIIVPLFAALRLAKFNIDENQKTSFIGLPSPAAAIFIISWPWIYFNHGYLSDIASDILFLNIICVVTSLLMVAPIELFSLKFTDRSWQGNKIRIVFLLLSLALLVFLFTTAVPFIILLYIILSLLHIFAPN